jgi:hypothetical protein
MANVKQHQRRLKNGKVVPVRAHQRKGSPGQVAASSTSAAGKRVKQAGSVVASAVKRRKRDRLLTRKSRQRQKSIAQLRDRSNKLRPIEQYGRVDQSLLADFSGKGFDQDAARVWNKSKFTPEEAASWTGSGFSLEQAREWRSSNFTRIEAAGWRDKGFSAAAARRRKKLGNESGSTSFGGSLEVAKDFHSRGFSFEEAVAWCKFDIPARTAAVLRVNGIRLADMALRS